MLILQPPKELNPHLEHSSFDAVFQTEAANFHYVRGHSQVSSFGFGGSNGHAVFWGDSYDSSAVQADIIKVFSCKLRNTAAPEVRPMGMNPDEWDSDLWDADVQPGDRYHVTLHNDGLAFDKPIKWIKDESVERVEEVEENAFYEITGRCSVRHVQTNRPHLNV